MVVYPELNPNFKPGSCSQYVVCAEDAIGRKPPSMTFEEAASIPLAGLTALQALKKYGDLTGKNVFIPAGCMNWALPTLCRDQSANPCTVSGTGLFACQLAKHVFKAGKVITTVSTAKVSKVPELLGEGTVDQSK